MKNNITCNKTIDNNTTNYNTANTNTNSTVVKLEDIEAYRVQYGIDY